MIKFPECYHCHDITGPAFRCPRICDGPNDHRKLVAEGMNFVGRVNKSCKGTPEDRKYYKKRLINKLIEHSQIYLVSGDTMLDVFHMKSIDKPDDKRSQRLWAIYYADEKDLPLFISDPEYRARFFQRAIAQRLLGKTDIKDIFFFEPGDDHENEF